jgi:hypothetical protein
MSTDTAKHPLPPYAAFATLKNFTAAFRTTGLPSRIDKTVMSKLSGAAQSRVTLALKYLGLVNPDGTPTNKLTVLVTGKEDEVKKQWSDLARVSYAFVFRDGFKLESATVAQLNERFDAIEGLSGDTTRKAMAFFLQMATEGGMTISPFLSSSQRRGSGSGTAKPRKPKKISLSGNGHENNDERSGSQPPFSPPPPAPEPTGHKTYTLDLSPDGKRVVKVTAPVDLKAEEVERLSGWLHFQYNVAWKDKTRAF